MVGRVAGVTPARARRANRASALCVVPGESPPPGAGLGAPAATSAMADSRVSRTEPSMRRSRASWL